jgi:hypothetical protein
VGDLCALLKKGDPNPTAGRRADFLTGVSTVDAKKKWHVLIFLPKFQHISAIRSSSKTISLGFHVGFVQISVPAIAADMFAGNLVRPPETIPVGNHERNSFQTRMTQTRMSFKV